MIIKTSIVYFLLSKEYSLVYNKTLELDNALEYPLRFFGETGKKTAVYLMEKDEYIANASTFENCSLIVLLGPAGQISGDKLSDSVAFVTDDVSSDELFAALVKIFLDLQMWDCDLKQAFCDNSDFQTILNIGQRLFHHPMVLMDEFFSRSAYTSDYMESLGFSSERLPIDELKELFTNENFIKSFTLVDPYTVQSNPNTKQGVLCKNILRDGHYIGRLVSHFIAPDISSGEIALFVHILNYIETMLGSYSHMLKQQNTGDSIHALMSKLFIEGETIPTKEIISVLNRNSWSISHQYFIIAIECTENMNPTTVMSYFRTMVEGLVPYSKSVIHDNHLICIVNLSLNKKNETLDEILTPMDRSMRINKCKAGVSDIFTSLSAVSYLIDYYTQAQISLRIGSKKEPSLTFYKFSDFKVDYIMEQILLDYRAGQLSHPALLLLIKHDEINETELVKTLYYYLQNKYNLSLTARALYTHRSTLIRRLNKIFELTDLNLDTMDEVIHLLVSFRMFGYDDIFSEQVLEPKPDLLHFEF
ncbi:MAG: helix-turn-helix domain-containing protein [Oscillospiraceae bacterium]|nr:helix-turn-helix domain-containing protein [Oscillospiraceae bacterium]